MSLSRSLSNAAQKRLRDLKGKISAQSKKNFVLERDVRYLDSRIALLIQNRMAADEVRVLMLC
jgi:Ras GTPase-activating-like protein IQGAP2/3